MRSKLVSLQFLLICANIVWANPVEKSTRATCGVCHPTKEGFTNVHLIPHTHDDVGWLKTVDQYFYGKNNQIQVAGVQYIIDSVVEELSKNPDRRFIYVETAFLKQWWDIQSDSRRSKMRSLVESGQLELISGAWSMHDEAVTHYQSIIDQFTLGLGTIDKMFDGLTCAKPTIGWQIDPFGHSRETASILAQLGFDGLFFARLDHQDRARRIKDKELEFVWQASAELGNASNIFAHAFYKHYSAPDGFCYDLVHCRDTPVIDDESSADYNVPGRVKSFVDFVNSRKDAYQTENMLVTMGDDFTYQQAAPWFDNIDRLIKHVNAEQENGSKINVIYSTPSCYLEAVHKADKVWKPKSDDMFPYSDGDHSFWTGYYSSRPTQKYMERKGNNLLQVCKQLSVLAGLKQEKWEDLDSLREAMGVMQHHDAITGTEKQHVADDYATMLHKGMVDCAETASTAINELAKKQIEVPNVEYKSCMLLNVSQCEISEQNDDFLVTLYNPLAQETSTYVRLPVDNYKYVVSFNGTDLDTTQMLKIPDHVLRIPSRNSTAEQELVFEATLPPLGFKTFHIRKTSVASPLPTPVEDDGKFNISGKFVEITVDPETGLFSSLYLKLHGLNYSGFSQNFYYYVGSNGNMESAQPSGAYIFRPDGDAVLINGKPQIETYKGDLVQEIHQVFNEWVSQVIRIYENKEFVEFEWLIGSIPAEMFGEPGKEVVTRYSKDNFPTDGVFYTDSNGRGSIERKRDNRPTWDVDLKESVAGNYYPVTTFISTKSGGRDFTILTDRAQGGTSLQDGTLELMLHRRLLVDDGRGVGEALNERFEDSEGLMARGRHLLSFAPVSDLGITAISKNRRWSRDNMVLAPWMFLATTPENTSSLFSEQYEVLYQGLNKDVAENVNILTLEPRKGGEEILVRFEHFYEQNDDPTLSAETSVPLLNLIKQINDERVSTEMTLGANRMTSERSRLNFKIESLQLETDKEVPDNEPLIINEAYIGLKPMEIRTFVLRSDANRIIGFSLTLASITLFFTMLNPLIFII